jgi:very-short-patch-repair endonuclease
VKYIYENKIKYYHPDFFIQDINLIIEIKSDYYFNLHIDKNLAKKKSCVENGFNFLFIINKDYQEFLNKIIKSS